MKILMTADTVGGVFGYALELARALGPRGVSVALATRGALLSPDQAAAAAALPNVTVHESAYRLEWQEEPWEDVARAQAWLRELAREVAPDLVHLNDYAPGALPWGVPSVVVGHSCVLSWFRAVKREDAPASWDRYRAAVTAGLRAASVVVAPSRAMLASLQEHYGPLRDTRAIANGRAPADYAPGPKEDFILAAGRIRDEAKNTDALVEVAPRLSWPVFVAGEGSAGQGAVHLGRLPEPELARWMGRAAIFAHPARYEPFGLAVLEAALAGCALVLGDIASLRELWDGVAIFVPPDDRDALAGALARLARRRGERASLGARARARALEYGTDRMAEAYLALYRELAAARARGGAACA